MTTFTPFAVAAGAAIAAVVAILLPINAAAVANAARLVLAVAVLAIYATSAIRVARSPIRSLDGTDHLLFGIAMTWAAVVLFTVNSEITRWTGVSMSWVVTPVVGALAVVGASFHLSAPGLHKRFTVLGSIILGATAYAALVAVLLISGV